MSKPRTSAKMNESKNDETPQDAAPEAQPQQVQVQPDTEKLVQYALAERQRRIARIEELEVLIHTTRKEADKVINAAAAERAKALDELRAYNAGLGLDKEQPKPEQADAPAEAA